MPVEARVQNVAEKLALGAGCACLVWVDTSIGRRGHILEAHRLGGSKPTAHLGLSAMSALRKKKAELCLHPCPSDTSILTALYVHDGCSVAKQRRPWSGSRVDLTRPLRRRTSTRTLGGSRRHLPALVPAAAATAAWHDPPPQPMGSPKPKDKSGIKKGWLSSGTLYPEGSTEAAPHLWRSKDIVGRKGKIFSLEASDAGYEIRGTFKEAGRFWGKEDFEVTRTGLTLRIRGHPDADAQSLVKGLDEHVTLPADADFSHISADYTDAVLTIKLGVNLQLRDAIQQLTRGSAGARAAHASRRRLPLPDDRTLGSRRLPPTHHTRIPYPRRVAEAAW